MDQFIGQPLGGWEWHVVAGYLVELATYAAFCGGILDEILRGFYPALGMVIFIPYMGAGFLAVVNLSVAVKGATGGFNIMEQILNFGFHIGMGAAGVNGHAKQNSGKSYCIPSAISRYPIHPPV